MFEFNVRIAAGSGEALGAVEMPRAFMLAGKGHPNILGRAADDAWVVDAEGVVLRSGAVYAWCRTGCCAQPRYWPSVEAAADFHGSSSIINGDGTVQVFDVTAPDEPAPGDVVPGGDGPGGHGVSEAG